jgi:cytochrome c-type biogenesis protein CcmH/NrfG
MATADKRLIIVVGIVAVAVLGSGGWLYTRLAARTSGAPTGALPAAAPPAAAQAGGEGGAMPGVPTVAVAAEKLAKRLAAQDGSADDWVLLARSYRELHRYPEALDAYAKAIAKSPDKTAFEAEAAAVRKSAGLAPR